MTKKSQFTKDKGIDKLEAIFVDVDDFFIKFEPAWRSHLIESGQKQRFKESKLLTSEVMTIVIAFHQSGFRDFKSFYKNLVCRYWQNAFPELVSYTRMLKLMQTVLVPLYSYLTHRKAKPTGIAFIDSTAQKVCHNFRIPRHKVFAESMI